MVCRHNVLTAGVFVIQLFINAEASIWGNVWVTTNSRFTNDMVQDSQLSCFSYCLRTILQNYN